MSIYLRVFFLAVGLAWCFAFAHTLAGCETTPHSWFCPRAE